MNLTGETLISRKPGILTNNIGGETVMMSIEESKYFASNKTGAYIWNLVETPVSLDNLCTKLAADFNITKERCMTDILPFIKQMQENNIIEITNTK